MATTETASKSPKTTKTETPTPGSPPVAPTAAKPAASGNGSGKPQETKAQRFVRIGERRIPKALKALAHIRNLASRASYEYTPEQAMKVCQVLLEAVNAIKLAFSGSKAVEASFRL